MAKSNVFQSEVGTFLQQQFNIAYRLDDVAFNRYGGRQVSAKPFDFFGATDLGRFWGAESKMVKSTRFPFRNLEDHQHKALSKLEIFNCIGLVFINWRTGRRGGGAVCLPYSEYLILEEKLTKEGRKSLKYEDVSIPYRLTRITGGWQYCSNYLSLIS